MSVLGKWLLNEKLSPIEGGLVITDIEGTFTGNAEASLATPKLATFPINRIQISDTTATYKWFVYNVANTTTYPQTYTFASDTAWRTGYRDDASVAYAPTSYTDDELIQLRTITITKDPNNEVFENWLMENATKTNNAVTLKAGIYKFNDSITPNGLTYLDMGGMLSALEDRLNFIPIICDEGTGYIVPLYYAFALDDEAVGIEAFQVMGISDDEDVEPVALYTKLKDEVSVNLLSNLEVLILEDAVVYESVGNWFIANTVNIHTVFGKRRWNDVIVDYSNGSGAEIYISGVDGVEPMSKLFHYVTDTSWNYSYDPIATIKVSKAFMSPQNYLSANKSIALYYYVEETIDGIQTFGDWIPVYWDDIWHLEVDGITFPKELNFVDVHLDDNLNTEEYRRVMIGHLLTNTTPVNDTSLGQRQFNDVLTIPDGIDDIDDEIVYPCEFTFVWEEDGQHVEGFCDAIVFEGTGTNQYLAKTVNLRVLSATEELSTVPFIAPIYMVTNDVNDFITTKPTINVLSCEDETTRNWLLANTTAIEPTTTPTFLDNILLGAGVYYRGLRFDGTKWTGQLMGATNGGGKITITNNLVDLDWDGVLVKTKGQTVKLGGVGTMEVNFAELSPELLKTATLFNDDGVDKSKIEQGDYVANFGFVGYTVTGSPIVVIFQSAICTSGLEFDHKNKEQSIFKLTLEAVADDVSKLPIKIYRPKVQGEDYDVIGWRRLNDNYIPFDTIHDSLTTEQTKALLEQYHFVIDDVDEPFKLSPILRVTDGEESMDALIIGVGSSVQAFPLELIKGYFFNEWHLPIVSCSNLAVKKWLYENTSPSAGVVYDDSLNDVWVLDENAISTYANEVGTNQGVMMNFQVDGHTYTSMRLVGHDLTYYRGDHEYVIAGDVTNGFNEKYRTIRIVDGMMTANAYAWLKNNATRWDESMVDESILGTWVLSDGANASLFGIYDLLDEYEAPITFTCDGVSYDSMTFGDSDLGGLTRKYGTVNVHDGRDWYDEKYKTITITGGYAPPTFKEWLLTECEKVEPTPEEPDVPDVPEEPEEPEAPVVDNTPIVGTWTFKDTITYDGFASPDVSFVCGSTTCSNMGHYVPISGEDAFDTLLVYNLEGNSISRAYNYTDDVWTSETHKTVTFSVEPTDETFKTWLRANATKVT